MLTGEEGRDRERTDSTVTKKCLLSKIDTKLIFIAKKLRHFLTAWHQITNGNMRLEIIKYDFEIDY